MRDKYLFDVDLARTIVQDGREPVELEEADTRFCVKTSELDDCHIPHVDPAIPGIISHIWFQDDDGAIVHGHVLIDGHHRAARCLQDQIPYRIHLLRESESRAIVLRSPAEEHLLCSSAAT